MESSAFLLRKYITADVITKNRGGGREGVQSGGRYEGEMQAKRTVVTVQREENGRGMDK